jgi:hypothetical protein
MHMAPLDRSNSYTLRVISAVCCLMFTASVASAISILRTPHASETDLSDILTGNGYSQARRPGDEQLRTGNSSWMRIARPLRPDVVLGPKVAVVIALLFTGHEESLTSSVFLVSAESR